MKRIIALALVFAVCAAGCITTTAPDGTTTTQLDVVSAQLALTAAQWAWEEWQEAHPADVDSYEAAALQARVEALQTLLDGLVQLREVAAIEPGEPGID